MSKRVVKIISAVLFTIFYAMVVAGHYIKQQRAHAPIILSAPAPDFTWKAADGSSHTLKELSGHVIVMHFWGAWCGPCRAEFPELLRNAGRLGKNVTVFAVSNDADPAKAQAFIRREEAQTGTKTPDNLIYVFDPDRKVTFDMFQTMAFPETIFIDSTLHMRRKIPGMVDWGSDETRNYLAQLKQ